MNLTFCFLFAIIILCNLHFVFLCKGGMIMPRKNKNAEGDRLYKSRQKDDFCKACKKLERELKREKIREKYKKEGNQI